ncbi:MAG: hypothetical protein Q4E62_04275 [Sutterellaceae bacterium]|nr:hypothetical protein [Sutterellaceae bacterium]
MAAGWLGGRWIDYLTAKQKLEVERTKLDAELHKKASDDQIRTTMLETHVKVMKIAKGCWSRS